MPRRTRSAAIERFEKAYLEQSYSEKPDIHEITAKSREILSIVLGDTGVAEILNSPLFRTHIMAVRSRHILASENAVLLALRTNHGSNAECREPFDARLVV